MKRTIIILDENEKEIDRLTGDIFVIGIGSRPDESKNVIKSYFPIHGNYDDLCREYLALGRAIHDKFMETIGEKK